MGKFIERVEKTLEGHGIKLLDEPPLDTIGTATLYRGLDTTLDRHVVVKVCNLDFDEEKQRKQLDTFNEAMKVAASIGNHQNIVSVYGGIESKNEQTVSLLILEYINGRNLASILKRTGPQPILTILRIMIHVARALLHAHRRNHLHHQLSPSHILIDPEGRPVLTPFRAVSIVDPEHNPARKWEQDRYLFPKEFDDKVDHIRLGLITYEMLTGKPYTGDDWNTELDSWTVYEKKRVFLEQLHSDDRSPNTDFRKCPDGLFKIVRSLIECKYKNMLEVIKDVANFKQEWETLLPLEPDTKIHLREVRESYRRCRLSKKFFQNIYKKLGKKNKDSEAIFVNRLGVSSFDDPKMERQYWLLREGIDLLIGHAEEPNSKLLGIIAKSHRRMNLRESYYSSFADAIVESIKETDHYWELKPDLQESWREIITPGIEFLKQNGAIAGNPGDYRNNQPDIFISYRREDTFFTKSVYNGLVASFGEHAVFMDTQGIEAGDKFGQIIHDRLACCRIFISIITPNWKGLEPNGTCRIDREDDWIRMETIIALQSDLKIIPVYPINPKVPNPKLQTAHLPDELKGLAGRQATEIREEEFETDFMKLCTKLQKLQESF